MSEMTMMKKEKHTRNGDRIIQRHKTEVTSAYGTGPGQMGKLAYTMEDAAPIQRQPDKDVIQFTQIKTGTNQTISSFSNKSDVILGAGDEEYCALFTRAALWTGHVMLILEWHDGKNTGNIVEHLIYSESNEDKEGRIERKKLVSEDKDSFKLDRLAASSTAKFQHKVLTLKDKARVIKILDDEVNKKYPYALGARGEEGQYDCVYWADLIWNRFDDFEPELKKLNPKCFDA